MIAPRKKELLATLRDLEAVALRLGSALDIPGKYRMDLLEVARVSGALLDQQGRNEARKSGKHYGPSRCILHGGTREPPMPRRGASTTSDN